MCRHRRGLALLDSSWRGTDGGAAAYEASRGRATDGYRCAAASAWQPRCATGPEPESGLPFWEQALRASTQCGGARLSLHRTVPAAGVPSARRHRALCCGATVPDWIAERILRLKRLPVPWEEQRRVFGLTQPRPALKGPPETRPSRFGRLWSRRSGTGNGPLVSAFDCG